VTTVGDDKPTSGLTRGGWRTAPVDNQKGAAKIGTKFNKLAFLKTYVKELVMSKLRNKPKRDVS